MKAKTFKRMSKRFISSLLSVLMVLSLFTVCAVGSTVTASAWNSIGGYTITVQTSSWSAAYLFVGKGDYTSVYSMSSTGTTGEYSVTIPSSVSWNDGQYFFFSQTNYGLSSGSGTSTGTSTVRSNLVNGGYTCSALVDRNSMELENGTTYSVASDGTVTIGASGGGGETTTGSYWIPATLYNYRTTNQISAASSVTEDTLQKSFNIDKTNGMASPWNSWENGTYSQYNHAVSDWFNGTSAVTPLYQGNFHDQNGGSIPSYYHFMLIANGANRVEGNDGAGTKSVAQELVDHTLNADGNITQEKVEMPQFSKKFMETANEDDVIQTVYEDLLFEAVATKKDNGNVWYSYDSAEDGNRSLDVATKKIRGVDSNSNGHYDTVYSCSTTGAQGSAGYFPFNESTPSNIANIVNSFGNRFDVTFTMTPDGTLNGEDLQFSFTGDDDLWVYIDGYLALDMGGSHNKAKGSFNLNTSKMYAKYSTGYYDGSYYSSKTSNNYSSYNNSGSAVALDSRIVESLADTTKEHTMTIFYMERGMFDSNLSFEFMLPQSNSLTINQSIDTTNVNSGLLQETMNTADLDAHEVVVKSDSASASSNLTAEIPVVEDFKRVDTDGAYTLFQKGTGNVTDAEGVPFTNSSGEGTMVTAKGTTFVWEDKNTSLDGTKTSIGTGTGVVESNGGVNLLYNQTAIFNDQFELGSNIQLLPQDDLSTFVIGEAESENPPTTEYNGRSASEYYDTAVTVKTNTGETVTLDSNNKFAFGDENDTSAKITASYTQTVKTGTVQFTKKLEADEAADSNTVFYFSLEFSNVFGGNDDTFNEYDVMYKVKNTSGVISDAHSYADKEDGIELKVGETAIIEGVPVGTTYRIIETGVSNESKGYSVASVTEAADSTVDAVTLKQDVAGGVVATVGTTITGANNVGHLDFNNTTKTTTVVYRFYDRLIQTGMPTSMESHYTYFTREMPGTLTGTTEDKDTVVRYAPTVKNPLKTYGLSESNIQFNYTLTAADVADAEGLNGLTAGDVVTLATYTAEDRMYSVDVMYRAEDGSLAFSTIERSFNGLIELDVVKTAESYTDANGTHNFRYWAKVVNRSSTSAPIYTPVSANFSYAYRVTDDTILKAVYDTDADFVQLDAPIAVDDAPYNASGLTSGYDISASERIYDSYSKDLADGSTQDRTRINIVMGSVGSKDTDTNITHVGYILLKNTGSYATSDLFSDSSLLSQLQNGATKIKDNKGNEYATQIKFYEVQNHVTNTPSSDGNGGTAWTPSEYVSGMVTLSSKNRANLVFDLKNTEDTQNNYYTCYTLMTRVDNVYDSNGEVVLDANGDPEIATYNYVSNTPAYFNLAEAEPYIQDIEITDDSYQVITYSKDQNGNADSLAGTITASKSYVKEGQKLTINVTPTSYSKNGITMESTLKSLKVGTVEITEDMFESYEITKTGKSTFALVFYADTHLPTDATTLDVTATFNVVENTTDVTVDATKVACTNGSVQVSNDGSTFTDIIVVTKGNSFTAKAIPATGYNFVSWSDGSTSETITVNVAADGSYTIPTPTFAEETFTLTLEAKDGGKITYSYGSVSGTVSAGGTKTLSGIPANTVVSLAATPTTTGATFQKWSDSSSAAASRTYTVTKDVTLKAYFELPVQTYTIYVANMGSWSGSIYYKTSEQGSWTAMTKLSSQYTKDGSNAYDMYSMQVSSNISWINLSDDSSGSSYADVTNNFGGQGKLTDGLVFEMNGNNCSATSNISSWSEYTVTAKTLTFKVGISNDWAENDGPDFYLTYLNTDGTRYKAKLTRISYNYYSATVDVYEGGDFTAYLLRCASGYVPSASVTSTISGSVHNVATTTIKSSDIANVSSGGTFDLNFTF